MKHETIEIEKDKDTATVFLNRPDVHNAMNEKLIKELTSCFNDLSKDDNVRVIILTGRGNSFCAGADLNWMKSMVNYSKDDNITDSNLLLELYDSILNCKKPVIGRINGSAFGGGIGLIAVCDIVIAVPECKFAFSEVKLGLIPAVISTYVVNRIGLSNMRRLFLTGERFDSNYAKEIGLVDFVVPSKDLNDTVKQYFELLRFSGPIAVKEIKRLIDAYEKLDIEKYKEFTVRKIADLRVSEEGQEGINAFLQKRKTKWSG